jgi:hypothetical protein
MIEADHFIARRKTAVPTPVDQAGTTESGTDFRAAYLAAVAQGEVPDSPLAEQVYHNWKRFPDAIVLTRVGKFYEVSLRPM